MLDHMFGGGVKLRTDNYGYYKSQINEDKCTDCGKCLSICPYNNGPEKVTKADSYVAYPKNREDAIGSSSGGIAHIIARRYLKLGYAIIGAVWSDDYKRVEHVIIRDEDGLEGFRKSKYVQSYTPDAFRQIKLLEKVVVFGAPCQIAGLRNLFGNRSGLVLIDFDCMGPAGLVLWDKYLDHINGKNSSGIKTLEMRNKKYSWMRYGTRVVYGDGREYFKDKYHDPFCVLYHLGHVIQDSCVKECKYLNDSKADLRIGDAWNYTDGYGKEQIRDGLSLISPLTELGEDVLKEIGSEIIIAPVDRIPNNQMQQQCNEKVWVKLRDPSASIMDVLKAYYDAGIITRFTRRISNLLSANDTVYLFIKKMLKRIR